MLLYGLYWGSSHLVFLDVRRKEEGVIYANAGFLYQCDEATWFVSYLFCLISQDQTLLSNNFAS